MLKRGLACVLVLCMLMVGVPAVMAAEETYIPIRTVVDLYNVRNDLTANYRLMNDIDLTEATAEGGDFDFMGNGWNPIGSNDVYGKLDFSGIFDGAGYSIIGMRIAMKNYTGTDNSIFLGLFSRIGKDAVVKNLNIRESSIFAHNNYKSVICAGAIARSNFGSILNCSSDCDIDLLAEDGATAGGIVAYNGGTISCCYNTGSITTYSPSVVASSGGIAGRHYDAIEISNCYNTGVITSNDYNAGIAGQSHSTISYCYNIGASWKAIADSSTGIISNCYFLKGCSSSSLSGTYELNGTQFQNTIMFSGFDFKNTWIVNPYAGYPYPQLQSNPQDLEERVELVRIMALPNKLTYYTGDALIMDGCVFEAVYISGRTEMLAITPDMLSGFDPTIAGKQTVTLTYRGKSDTFEITVEERPAVTDVTLISPPDKTEFAIGSAFDMTGASLQIVYDNGTSEIKAVTSDMVSGGNINHLGDQELTITYEGWTLPIAVKVVSIKLEKVEWAIKPTKVNYIEGEELDTTGLTLTTHFNNGRVETVTNGFTTSGYASVAGTHTVTVDYSGFTLTFDVTVEHKWNTKYTIDTPATCTTAGSQSIHCTMCDATKNAIEIPAINHLWSVADHLDATCTSDGYTDYVCMNNNTHTRRDVEPSPGHVWDTDYTVDDPATCEKEGQKSIHCTGCDLTKDVTVIPMVDCQWKEVDRQEATCTQEGYVDYVCVYNPEHTKREALPAPGHEWSTEWSIDKEASCTEAGSKSHHCLHCEEKQDVTELPKEDHEYGEWEMEVEATPEKDGTEVRKCLHCDATESRSVKYPVMFGDLDESGEVTASDALLALQMATNKVDFTDEQSAVADVDGDGKVTANDALLILQYATKKINSFPIEG